MADLWVIWSEENRLWWRANCYGYTNSLAEAGRFTEEEAKAIAREANEYLPEGKIKEVPMPDPLPPPRQP